MLALVMGWDRDRPMLARWLRLMQWPIYGAIAWVFSQKSLGQGDVWHRTWDYVWVWMCGAEPRGGGHLGEWMAAGGPVVLADRLARQDQLWTLHVPRDRALAAKADHVHVALVRQQGRALHNRHLRAGDRDGGRVVLCVRAQILAVETRLDEGAVKAGVITQRFLDLPEVSMALDSGGSDAGPRPVPPGQAQRRASSAPRVDKNRVGTRRHHPSRPRRRARSRSSRSGRRRVERRSNQAQRPPLRPGRPARLSPRWRGGLFRDGWRHWHTWRRSCFAPGTWARPGLDLVRFGEREAELSQSN